VFTQWRAQRYTSVMTGSGIAGFSRTGRGSVLAWRMRTPHKIR